MEDPHAKILGTLVALFNLRKVSAETGAPYFFFWDALQPDAETFEEYLEDELDRTSIYEQLQERIQEQHQFKDWLPPKVRLAFLSSFERDARMKQRTRIQAFQTTAKDLTYRAQMAQETIDALKAVAEGPA